MTRMTGPDCAVMCNLINTQNTHVGKAIATLREILPHQSIATCIIVYLMVSEEYNFYEDLSEVTAEEARSKSGRCFPSGVMARVVPTIIVEVEVL